MRYFIGNPKVHRHEDYVVISDYQAAKELIDNYLKSNAEHGFDTETTGKVPHVDKVILIQFGNEENQFIIQRHYWTDEQVLSLLPDPTTNDFVLQNGKFDHNMMKTDLGYEFEEMWDIMIVDQKIYQGMLYNGKSRPDGLRVNIKAIIERRLGIEPEYMDKEVRTEFVGLNYKTWVPEPRHILYGSADIKYLIPVKKKQMMDLETYGPKWYAYNIAKYIGIVAGDIETHGWNFNVTKWRENIKIAEERKFFTECELDRTVLELKDQLLDPNDIARKYFLGGKFTRPRKKEITGHQTDLFGNPMVALFNANLGNTNWSSSVQVAEIFAKLKCPLPTDDKRDSYKVPQLIRTVKKGKRGLDQIVYKLDTSRYKYTTNQDELNKMMLEVPNNPGAPIVNLLIKHRDYSHQITGFGENFIKKINPVTGRLHTIYRTDSAETGRFQSGEKEEKGKQSYVFNSQNIPAKAEYRSCFTVDTTKYSVTSADLSGAEVTIMCDKAHDEQLYNWAVINDDAHSPIATACWRNIYLYRAGLARGLWITDKEFWWNKDKEANIRLLKGSDGLEYEDVWEWYKKSLLFTISKDQNKKMRTEFKGVTFGTVYGMHAGKCMKVLNISKIEASIVIETIRSTIPKTFAYVESQADLALSQGYITIDNRTGSKVYFPEVIKLLRAGQPINEQTLGFKTISDISGAARNYTIQGTQASMLKEAKIEIHLWNKRNQFDAAILNTVHDELETRQPREYDGINGDKKVLWISDKGKEIIYPGKELYLPVINNSLSKSTLHALLDKELAKELSYPEFVRHTMIEAANRYLSHYKMGSSIDVADTWVK